jgi:hypothetical protein
MQLPPWITSRLCLPDKTFLEVGQDAVGSMDHFSLVFARQGFLEGRAGCSCLHGYLAPHPAGSWDFNLHDLVIPDPTVSPDGPSAERARVSEVEVCGITSPTDMVIPGGVCEERVWYLVLIDDVGLEFVVPARVQVLACNPISHVDPSEA